MSPRTVEVVIAAAVVVVGGYLVVEPKDALPDTGNISGLMRFLVITALAVSLAGCATGREEIEREFGYPNVQAAFAALKARKDVRMSVHEGWTIIDDTPHSTLWSFAPPEHPAYPAVIRRQLLDRDGGKVLGMSALCQGPRAACDKLVEEMRATSEPHPPPAEEKPAVR